MALPDYQSLKNQARDLLSQTSENPRILVLIHTGVIVGMTLLFSILNLILEHFINQTGGLDGVSARSLLETLQSLLTYANLLFTPFWSAGFLYCVIRLVRDRQARPQDLLQGFHRFGSVFFFNILKTMLIFFAVSGAMYLAATVFLMTPFSSRLSEATAALQKSGSLILSDGTVNLDAIPKDVLRSFALPLIFMFLLIFIPLGALISYSLRLSEYLIMNSDHAGGFYAALKSNQLMKGHRFEFFKLDLHFWWFYVIEALITAVIYLDVILGGFGITVPLSPSVSYILLLVVYGGLELAFHLKVKLPVDTAYVLAFDAVASQDSHPEL